MLIKDNYVDLVKGEWLESVRLDLSHLLGFYKMLGGTKKGVRPKVNCPLPSDDLSRFVKDLIR